jgi:DNA-binding NarL/FixJ family response regulator
VKSLLAEAFDIVAAVRDGSELIRTALRTKPDIVVLDISMPVVNGLEAAREIRQAAPQTKIVFLSQQSDKAFVQEAFRAGASAYVLKQFATSDLKPALQSALEGRRYISAALGQGTLLHEPDIKSTPVPDTNVNFTPRQREILRLLAGRNEVKDIARTLGISTKTVEFHISALMDHLDLQTSEELMQYAARRWRD